MVLDVLLICNLVLLALCALRLPRHRARLDDILAHTLDRRSTRPGPMAQVLTFPAGDELARRRARAAHPSGIHPPRPAVLHPSQSARLPGRFTHPSGPFSHPSSGF